MILHLAQGEPSYLPDGLFEPQRDVAYPDLAPYLWQYVDRPQMWAVVAFLAGSIGWCSLQETAEGLSVSEQEVLSQLDPLVESGLVQERMLVTGPKFRFAASNRLRSFMQLSLTFFEGDNRTADINRAAMSR